MVNCRACAVPIAYDGRFTTILGSFGYIASHKWFDYMEFRT